MPISHISVDRYNVSGTPKFRPGRWASERGQTLMGVYARGTNVFSTILAAFNVTANATQSVFVTFQDGSVISEQHLNGATPTEAAVQQWLISIFAGRANLVFTGGTVAATVITSTTPGNLGQFSISVNGSAPTNSSAIVDPSPIQPGRVIIPDTQQDAINFSQNQFAEWVKYPEVSDAAVNSPRGVTLESDLWQNHLQASLFNAENTQYGNRVEFGTKGRIILLPLTDILPFNSVFVDVSTNPDNVGRVRNNAVGAVVQLSPNQIRPLGTARANVPSIFSINF